MTGLRLLLAHPEIPSCADCQGWLYEPEEGWRLRTRAGQPVPRLAGQPTPCGSCPKAEGGKPAPHRELSAKNWAALRHYYQVKAGAPLPEDALCQSNAGLIRWVEDQAARDQARQIPPALLALLKRK